MTHETERKLPINLATLEIRKTELCYVTSVNPPTRTFFTQFCKFPYEELNAFNTSLNDFCHKLIESGNQDVNKIRRGELVCARYYKDQFWYRATVMNRDQEQNSFTVMFVDYGNVETVPATDLTRICLRDFPVIERVPFGIQCFMENSEVLSEKDSKRMLEKLKNNYLMVKFNERQSSVQWKVDVPKHAYNIPFWLAFQPDDQPDPFSPDDKFCDSDDTSNQSDSGAGPSSV